MEKLSSTLKNLFIRTTLSNKFIPEIDGLRFLAIGLVFLHHLSAQIALKVHQPWARGADRSFLNTRVFVPGNYGVQLFFVISGMVLGLPYAAHYLNGEKKVIIWEYFKRRITRLEPPYIICMTGFLVALVLFNHQSLQALLPHYVASLLYLHSWIFGFESKINIVAWSLEIEIQFYILAPFLAMFFFRGSKSLRRFNLVAVSLLAIALQLWVGNDVRFHFSVLNYLQYFLLGFLLADIYISDWKRSPQKTPLWDGVGALGLISLPWVLEFPLEIRNPSLFGIMGVIYFSVFRGPYLSRCFSSPLISGIGGMCYSIYLFHGFILIAVLPITSKLSLGSWFLLNYTLQALLTVIPVLLITSTYYLLIEKPCMQRDWPQKLYAFLTSGGAQLPHADVSTFIKIAESPPNN